MWFMRKRKDRTFPPDGASFYCYERDCFDPLPLDQMCYGCVECSRPRPLYKDKDNNFKEVFPPAKLTRLWGDRSKGRRCHSDFNTVPWCPVCENQTDYPASPISEYGFWPPIGIWGGPNAGKTVFCAALAREIQQKLYKETGLSKQFLNNDREAYFVDVVNPLFDDGILPAKTQFGAHRKLVLQVRHSDGREWPVRCITLTDMAGEVYDGKFESIDDQDLERLRRPILLSKESIFLVNPEVDPNLKASARVDLYAVVRELLGIIQDAGTLHSVSQGAVHRLVQQMENILRTQSYPNLPAQFFLPLARQLAGSFPEPLNTRLVDPICECLTSQAKGMRETKSLQNQLEPVAQWMRDLGLWQSETGKLDHRIAITVPKGDILNDLNLSYDMHLRDFRRQTKKEGKPASVRQWQQILGKISEETREELSARGDDLKEFVEFVKGEFLEVGFFVVSSLGRDTESYVKESIYTPSNSQPSHQFINPLASQSQSPLRSQTSSAQSTQQARSSWILDKRVKLHPEIGRHAPEPRDVLLPLLWLLTRTGD